MQRTSSQTNAINIANNSSNSSNVKLSNSKPPILPKPQISKLDCGVPRVVKPNPPPLEFSTAHSKPKSASSENCVSVPNNLVFPINRPSKISEKPPEISPKPQLPPKLHVANLSKPGITSRTLASPTKTNLFLESSLCTETNSTKSTIKVQNKNMKKKENNEFIIQKGLLNCMELPKNLILAKQKSGSLDRKEELNWKVKDLINDEDQLTKFCKQVEMCSKHSHLLKNDDTTLASGKLKKKLEQLDLASNISNVSSSAPFLSDLSTQTNVMSNNSCTNEFSEQLNFVNGGSTNESENFNVKEEKTLKYDVGF